MGRDAPNARSSCALVAISAGAASYVAVDRQFLVGGFSQYAWCFCYISIICVEISFARHILSSEDRLQSKWGPTLYTNALALFPMTCAGFMLGGIAGRRMPRYAEGLGGLLLIAIGTQTLLQHTVLG